MSKAKPKTAVSKDDEETAVSSLYPGMQVLTLPGVAGVALVPEPDAGSLTALQITRFLKREAPAELRDAGAIYSELFVRAPLVDWRFEGLELTDEKLISLDYPAEIAKWVYVATQPHLDRIFSKKN